ncbi:MAG: cytochrome c [Gammaproteobacteria bacterium]
MAPNYDVTCPPDAKAAEQCQVDKETYIGWRTFAGQCQVCHGGSALGSTFAPNLLDRFHQRVDYPRFVEVVTHGYTGQVGAMPAWKGNPNVEPHIDQMYRYLKARADGALPPGRPARKP